MKYDANSATQIGDLFATQVAQVEARNHAFAHQERHLGIEGLQERGFTAADTPDQVDELPALDLQIDARKHHLALAQERLLRTTVAAVIDRYTLQPYDLLLLHLIHVVYEVKDTK